MQFDYDNPLIRFLNKTTDLLVLNIVFLLCCLPVITIGASLTAMYAVNLRSVRYGDGYVLKNFFKSFRESFVQATLAWLIMLGCWVILYIDVRFWSAADMGAVTRMMLAVSYAIAFVLFALQTWLFPVIAKMKDRLGVQFSNAAKMSVACFFPYTAACLAVQGIFLYMSLINPAMVVIMLVIGFAAVSYICSFFLYKVFSRLITEESLGADDLLYQDKGDDDEIS
jgi:uncharacterized membrane protein YesL